MKTLLKKVIRSVLSNPENGFALAHGLVEGKDASKVDEDSSSYSYGASDAVMAIAALLAKSPERRARVKNKREEQLRSALINGLLALGASRYGVTTKDVARVLEMDLERARTQDRPPQYAKFIESLIQVKVIKADIVDTYALGQRLRRHKDKRCGNKYIGTESGTGAACWKILID
jgi:hypothetical protein